MCVDSGDVGCAVYMFDDNILKNNVGSTIAIGSRVMSVTFIVRVRVAVHLRTNRTKINKNKMYSSVKIINRVYPET